MGNFHSSTKLVWVMHLEVLGAMHGTDAGQVFLLRYWLVEPEYVMVAQDKGFVNVKDGDQGDVDTRMKVVKHKIIILSGKGGVGKSTFCSLLSLSLAKCQSTNKVGVVDLDICGPSIPKLLAVEGIPITDSPYGWKPLISPHDGIKVMSVGSMLPSDSSAITFRGPRKTGLIKRFLKDTFWGKLDYLLFDTPPGTSDEHMTIVKLLKNVNPDGAVIVTTPQDVALDTIRREINFCKKMGVKIIGIVENMSNFVCPCCEEITSLFPSQGVKKLADSYNVPYLGQLPMDPRVAMCSEQGENAMNKYPDSHVVNSLQNIVQQIHTEIRN
ncbi:hypothetical protein FSP39_019274 [Pinctada imbricata]|uniref:Cytosolic Fe-S cluster assembly factor NUBP1 homolog n=1 Tax=Pinctada imbricata TaxID=66713 RepID=A0AA88YK41_PINIB|nr:hypothetical protein FSP39_019274 [Pinctada imbricata]